MVKDSIRWKVQEEVINIIQVMGMDMVIGITLGIHPYNLPTNTTTNTPTILQNINHRLIFNLVLHPTILILPAHPRPRPLCPHLLHTTPLRHTDPLRHMDPPNKASTLQEVFTRCVDAEECMRAWASTEDTEASDGKRDRVLNRIHLLLPRQRGRNRIPSTRKLTTCVNFVGR